MTEKQFLKKLRKHLIAKYGTLMSASNHYSVFQSYLSLILSGKTPPKQSMLDDMKLERKVVVAKRVTYDYKSE